ncbi:sigma-70 family RNA polymerase sigma factor [Candidatus Poribacteria bacterium]
MASRRCKLWVRAASRRIDRDFVEDQAPKVMDAPSLDSYREDQVDESVREALSSLPEVHREILVLRYFGGMNSKEIAKAIGVSPAAIRMRLTRAREQLKEEMVAMMDTVFEGQRLPMGFTLRVVEAVKHIKINPMPRMAGVPWGLSLAVGIIVTVLGLNSQMSVPSDMAIPTGFPLPVETKVLKTGEIPVDILKTDEISVIASKQRNVNGREPQFQTPQNALMLAPRAEVGKWTKKADMPTPRGGHCAAAVNGKIYAVGGGPHETDVEEYDPLTDTWTKKADAPDQRGVCWASAGVVNDRIYVIGGEGIGGCFSRVWEYNPSNDKWTKKLDMPTIEFSIKS